MASLKDTVISGSLRVTDTIFSTNLNLTSLTASYAVVTDANKNLTSRAITNNTSATAVNATTNLITENTLYYYKGTSNIVTVGTISSGTWQGTSVKVGYGGTGTTTAPTQGGIIFGSSTSAYGSTAAGSSGQLLQSAGTGTPTWITATNSNTASTIVKRDSSGNFSAGTITASLSGNATSAYFVGKGQHTAAVTANEFTPEVGTLTIVGNVSNTTMTHTSNANAEMIIKAHPTSGTSYFEARLGFSSDGNLYYMPVNTSTWSQVWKAGDSVTGAVWNDYAEYRKSVATMPGCCVEENDDGVLTLTQSRLIPGASIISDTWGFSQGQTEEARTPVAVAGRVLAYPYRNRGEYHAGQAVCSGPDGTVDIMSRHEIQKYPDAIIGFVSEIPDYQEWGGGDREPVKVNGRIWIKIR